MVQIIIIPKILIEKSKNDVSSAWSSYTPKLNLTIPKNPFFSLYDVKNKSHENYELQPTKKAFIPLIDKFHLKYIKYKLRFLKKFNL